MLARNTSESSTERLAARRRRARKRFTYVLGLLLVLLIGAGIYGLWQPSVRVTTIQVFGADQSLAQGATEVLAGTYLGIVPRDSIFFIPERAIRARIHAEHREIAALSIFREGFDGLSIRVTPRVPIAQWCGLAPTEGVEAYCYVFDANGLVYAAASPSDKVLNPAILYAPLAGDGLEPLDALLADRERLPSVFDFARQLGTFASSTKATAIIIRGDEVDTLLASGTRVTYVLGNEQNAFTALTSSKENFSLADGSIDYVDLRFEGKVYLKRK